MNSFRRLRMVVLFALATTAVAGQPSPAPTMPPPVNLQPLRAKAQKLFTPDVFTKEPSKLKNAGDLLLLGSQLIAAAIIIGGLLAKMRDEHRQMEGVATMLLKVAFIATIPAWQANFVTATDGLAGALEYKSATEPDAPVADKLWLMLQQWAPPSSPALDALDAQAPETPPASDAEASWTLNAWNWAKGMGVADASMFHALWQAASGSLRGLLVFGSCALMSCAVSFVIALTYFAELARYLLLTGGVALLPIFIAGVGIDAFRSHSLRALLAVATLAAWPIGWALANIMTAVMADGLQGWMAEIAKAALAQLALPAAPFAVAAPYVAWGTLFLFIGITGALCLWQMAALYYVPVLLARLFAAVATSVSTSVASHVDLADGSRAAPGGSTSRGSVASGRVPAEPAVVSPGRLAPPRRPPALRR